MLRSGTILGGRYELLKPIAQGGMGMVWRADDRVLGRPVAVKVLLPALAGDTDFAARFAVEARVMATLNDPGIVEIYDYDQDDGFTYLVMQFVDGESLHQVLTRERRLRPAYVMTIVAQAGAALHQAHLRGVIHRDVKPGNLLVDHHGRLALTDFGIARMVASDRLTEAGAIVGTAAYLAPEQVLGEELSPATDVYALGVVAYECLMLRRPFEAHTPVAVALMHTRDAPPPLPNDLPVAVRHIVERALAKDPADRWPSAAAMAEAATLAGLAAGDAPPSAAPESTGETRFRFGPTSAAGSSLVAGSSSARTPAEPLADVLTAPVDSSLPWSGPPASMRGRRRPRTAVLASAGTGLIVLVMAGALLLRPPLGQPAEANEDSHGTSSTGEGGAAPGTPGAGGPSAGASATPGSTRGGVAPSGLPGVPRASGTPGSSPGVPAPTTAPGGGSTSTPPPPPQLVTVPYVVGLQLDDAKARITAAGLNVIVYLRNNNYDCSVISQDPTGGAEVKPGTPVTLVAGQPPPFPQECLLPV